MRTTQHDARGEKRITVRLSIVSKSESERNHHLKSTVFFFIWHARTQLTVTQRSGRNVPKTVKTQACTSCEPKTRAVRARVLCCSSSLTNPPSVPPARRSPSTATPLSRTAGCRKVATAQLFSVAGSHRVVSSQCFPPLPPTRAHQSQRSTLPHRPPSLPTSTPTPSPTHPALPI